MKPCKRPHVYFNRQDFTAKEMVTRNKLSIIVNEEHRKICKRCGHEEEK